ncbi:DUF805 domain-containing protein [Staphylococcus pseudoxylosus]|uniref:DUF805 domain-containing protein n=1 Tax=Staphylococcus pseudoxylosus TaxID=2282419 RepID=UPI000FF41FBE|nr:DUF805 domain-containing protein [Staphylococcus pseudoxylosus]MEB5781979.1 DUF805 domain-containing protein [Staphylococcus pseudoxylosus]RQM84305.1 hypothetical protein CO206_12645 [Staphylococcus xylosus]
MDNPVVGIVLVIVGVIYLVIAIVALVVCCSKGQKEDNQYGPNPKRTVHKKISTHSFSINKDFIAIDDDIIKSIWKL